MANVKLLWFKFVEFRLLSAVCATNEVLKPQVILVLKHRLNDEPV